MHNFLSLRNLSKDDRGTDGVSIEARLRDRMKAIAKDIETCAATCDSFQKKKLIGTLRLMRFPARFADCSYSQGLQEHCLGRQARRLRNRIRYPQGRFT